KRVPRLSRTALTITGVRPHRKTGIYWLRLRTPPHLIARAAELVAMGVQFKVEHHRSLETRDPKKVQSAVAEKRMDIERVWKGWEVLLRSGPRHLSFKNVIALAGERAKQFLATHEDEPFMAPPPPSPRYQEALAGYDARWLQAHIRGLPEKERLAFLADA